MVSKEVVFSTFNEAYLGEDGCINEKVLCDSLKEAIDKLDSTEGKSPKSLVWDSLMHLVPEVTVTSPLLNNWLKEYGRGMRSLDGALEYATLKLI
jgi:hypothetical protein